jgi:hypothetical protein
MNAENELLNAYREWHRLACAEAKAIRTRDWDLLADCQLAIADFQTLTGRLITGARNEWERAGLNPVEKERHVQVYIQGLIELTRNNQLLLQRAKDAATARLGDLNQAGQNIRRLRQSYGHAGGLLHAT